MKTLVLARAHLAAVAVLGLLALSASLLVAGAPRALQQAYDQAMRSGLSAAPAVQTDLAVRFEPYAVADTLTGLDAFEIRDRGFREDLPARLKPLVSPPGVGTGHMSAKTFDTPVMGSRHDFVNLAWLSDADKRVDWVSGTAPGAPTSVKGPEGEPIPLFEVGLLDEAVTKMGMKVGDVRTLGNSDFIAIKVVGVFRVKDAADRYWSHNADVLHVNLVQQPGAAELDRYTTVLTSAEGLGSLTGKARRLVYSWVLAFDAAKAGTTDIEALTGAVAGFKRLVTLTASGYTTYTLDTRLPELLAAFNAKLATAQTVMFLVLGGLLVVGIGVIVLAVQLLLERLDPALTLIRARGGSLRQVSSTGTALVALAVAPGVLAGFALSTLVAGPVSLFAYLGPVLVLLASTAFAAVRLALTHVAPLHERRGDVATARPSAKRITLEVLVVGLALTGAYLLRSRGLTTSVLQQGQDPFLLLVPVALTVAAALVTLRCYPYPLRLIVRAASRGRRAVPFLGLTRAARARSFTALPVLILLPALAVSVFASVVSSGITTTQELAAWRKVGAPIKVTVDGELPAVSVEKVRRLAGVDLVVPAQTGRVQVGFGGERAQIIAVDLAAWQRALDGSPLTLPSLSGSGIPALVSKDLAGRGTMEIGWQSRMKVETRGVIDSVPGFFTSGKFMVVPLSANQAGGTRVQVNTLLIAGSVSAEAVTKALAVPRAVVESQATVLADIQHDPLTDTIRTTLMVVTVALAVYALIAVIIALVISAADRGRAVSFLRTLGLSAGQAQRLTVLEISPMIVLTALAGLALGLGLPAALGPGVDLSSYTGDLAVGNYDLDLLTPTLLAAGLTAVAVGGAYVHTAISRRRSLGSVLRVGD